jgi:chemotaxis methyl-accepting protein methylase
MPYVHTLPISASFRGKGLYGYTFGPLKERDLEVLYIESEKGHDTFLISKKITRVYYVLSGKGYFTIADNKYNVGPGMLVEVPPRVEYCYSGKMTLLALCKPRWFRGNDTLTKWNPDVVGYDSKCGVDGGPWLSRLVRFRVFGKSPTNAFLRLNQRVWNDLPLPLTAVAPIRLYGYFLHRLARIQGVRAQALNTFFLRNRPQLELVRRVLDRKSKSDPVRVAVLGCSLGAEAYSVAWRIRSARPDLKLVLHAVDISKEAVEFAKRGAYPLAVEPADTATHDRRGAGGWRLDRPDSELTGEEIFERLTPMEMEEFFDRDGDTVTIKSWIRDGIAWHVGDVTEPGILDALGLQDVVVANNFLCHMGDSEAERALRNIARLVAPQGYLIVSGIDLDVRTKVACGLGWKPVDELLEEIHEGDPCLRRLWPCHYAGLEPLDKSRQDWRIRYAATFQLGPTGAAPPPRYEKELCEVNQSVQSHSV